MSMRITHVIFGFTTGGAELMLADIMAEQAEAGHEVSLVVINHHYEEALLRTAQMDSCCVAPRYQGHHLEGRLLLAAEARLRGTPYQHFVGTVHPDNAASLYTALHRGYRIAAANCLCYGDKLRHIVQKDVG